MPLAEVSQLAAGAGAPIPHAARRRSSGGSWADLAFGPWPKDDDFLVPDSVRAERDRRAQRARRWAAAGAAAGAAALLALGALLHATAPPLAASPPSEQQQNFLMLFSGHQGSSAVEDIIASWDGVFVPGFEPLEIDAVSAAQKLAFVDAVWRVPRAPAEFPAWRDALLPVPGIRVNRTAVRDFAAVEARDYRFAGFKLRPYAADGGSHGGSGFVDFLAAFLDDDEGGHSRRRGLRAAPNNRPGMTGLDPAALKAALDRHNVTVVLTQRANALKEALSWYRARERGVSQFHREHAAAPVHVDLSTFLRWLRYVEQTNRAVRTAVSPIGMVARHISWTDLPDAERVLRPADRAGAVRGLRAGPAGGAGAADGGVGPGPRRAARGDALRQDGERRPPVHGHQLRGALRPLRGLPLLAAARRRGLRPARPGRRARRSRRRGIRPGGAEPADGSGGGGGGGEADGPGGLDPQKSGPLRGPAPEDAGRRRGHRGGQR